MIIDLTEREEKLLRSEHFVWKSFDKTSIDLPLLFLKNILVDIGAFDGEQK